MPDRPALDVERLRSATADSPWRQVEVVDETGSTNADLVARAARGDDIAGAVLLAELQTAGRGRHGRSWSAPSQSQISMSVGVDSTGVAPERWGWLPLLTGVAVADAVRSLDVDATVKWPNDILVGGRKLAGILAEVAAPVVVVVGLGVNVSLTEAELPDPNAVSLAMLGHHVDRTDLTVAVLQALDARIAQWRSGDTTLPDDYRAVSATVGSRVRAILPGDAELLGTATGIDTAGRLLIDTATGESMTVSAGDITHLRPAN